MLHALWLVVAHDLLKNTLRWRHGKLVAFVCSTWRAVLKIFASLILIQQVNTSKSLQQELFTSWKEKTKARETCSWRLENALTVTNLRNSCHLATSWQQFWTVYKTTLLWTSTNYVWTSEGLGKRRTGSLHESKHKKQPQTRSKIGDSGIV